MNNKFKILIIVISLLLVTGGFLVWKGNDVYTHVYTSENIPFHTSKYGRVEIDQSKQKELNILFGGDLMFDRYIRQVAEKRGNDFIFEKLDAIFKNNDLNLVNLEGPITDNQSVSVDTIPEERNHFIFTFDKSLAGKLKKQNINLVNLGNNHILNFKEEGVKQTENYLTQAGVEYFGSPISEPRYIIKNIQGLKIAFVSYNQFIFQGKEKALEDIKNAKAKSDIVVLYAHWEKEYETQPLESVKTLAHEFVDAGADLIIGSHPHVVQPKEIYQGKTIYYSLGNFIFDQYFQPETMEGLAVKATINSETKAINLEDFPLILQNNGQTGLKSS